MAEFPINFGDKTLKLEPDAVVSAYMLKAFEKGCGSTPQSRPIRRN